MEVFCGGRKLSYRLRRVTIATLKISVTASSPEGGLAIPACSQKQRGFSSEDVVARLDQIRAEIADLLEWSDEMDEHDDVRRTLRDAKDAVALAADIVETYA